MLKTERQRRLEMLARGNHREIMASIYQIDRSMFLNSNIDITQEEQICQSLIPELNSSQFSDTPS